MQGTPGKTELTEENYSEKQFVSGVPWQYGGSGTSEQRDSDGFSISGSGVAPGLKLTRKSLSSKIWDKFHNNPQVNTSMRGLVGRICGNGFATISDIKEIDETILEIETDYRNRLYDYWPKYFTRAFLSGELFLCFTVHPDGFIEIDFVDPDAIDGDFKEGILFHPKKTRMPLIYSLNYTDNNGTTVQEHIPSIYLARYPELINVARKQRGFSEDKLKGSRADGRLKAFKNVGGFNQFIVSWDMGLMTNRSTSHLQTVLQWLNLWENLKLYEVDHKKASGAYVWVVKFTNVKSWIQWMNLTDAQRATTGIAAPKSPGGTLVLGPDMEIKSEQPQLPKISDSDTDIMQNITSGLNEAEDVTSGQSKGTFASVQASRGPMSDRISDEMAYAERFLRYDFWGNIFFLKNAVGKFPKTFKVKEVTHFDDKKESVLEEVTKKPEQLLDVIFPVSAIENPEGQATAYLGSKHGSLNDTAGIPNEVLMKKMGIRGYRRMRLQKATEDELYPPTIMNVDQESLQENQLANQDSQSGAKKKPVQKKQKPQQGGDNE
jgi:hypothetical protein